MPTTPTREHLLTTWHNARRLADQRGALVLRPDAFAGHLLEMAGGDASRARLLVPCEIESLWGAVLSHLDAVLAEERDARGGVAA